MIAALPPLVLAAAVSTGLDAVAAGDDALLRGKRIGLLAHAASRTGDGRHAVDVFRSRGLDLRKLFAPEHGLRGQLAAGEVVQDGRDAATGLPVVSLYGGKTRPSPEDLADLDVLAVDLQDAGVRFYTYAATLLLALESAREAGRTVVVLDRPNPLGGNLLEGPPSDPPAVVAPSLLNRTPGPLVHGLTLGELALFAQRGRPGPAVRVIAMRGWRRSMTWSDTGLPWTPPSPNLRSAEAALAYPGTCLLEATNVSEGRGTAAPFLLFGAPWLDGETLVRQAGDRARAAGFSLAPAVFTPERGPAAPTPRHEGALCRGGRVSVARVGDVRPYALGVGLLTALRAHPEFALRDGGAALDRLVGSTRLRMALEAGHSVDAILAADGPGLEAWERERAPFLLYR